MIFLLKLYITADTHNIRSLNVYYLIENSSSNILYNICFYVYGSFFLFC